MSSALSWALSPARDTLDLDEAHVWAWPLDATPATIEIHAPLLDDAEQQRLQRFHFADDRARYALAHAHMRRLLGAYLRIPPQSVDFRIGDHGKPHLAGGELHFSLSHSKTVAALAVVRAGPVGIDFEDVRPIGPEVAASQFSEAEVAQLETLRGQEWLQGFYRCWTRKEAILKGEGVGLHYPLHGFDVSLTRDAAPALRNSRVPFQHTWTLHDVPPSPNTMGALATAGGGLRVSLFQFAG